MMGMKMIVVPAGLPTCFYDTVGADRRHGQGRQHGHDVGDQYHCHALDCNTRTRMRTPVTTLTQQPGVRDTNWSGRSWLSGRISSPEKAFLIYYSVFY